MSAWTWCRNDHLGPGGPQRARRTACRSRSRPGRRGGRSGGITSRAGGPGEHQVAAGLADHLVAVAHLASAGGPGRRRCACTTSMPASAQSRATVAAWTSEPPASTSSRSRQASMWMRRRPAAAAMSPSLAWVASVGSELGAVGSRQAGGFGAGPGHGGAVTLCGRRSPSGCRGSPYLAPPIGHGAPDRPSRRAAPAPAEHAGHVPTQPETAHVSPPDRDFDGRRTPSADVEGWMTPGQARLLWDWRRAVRAGGRIVEIGSFRGRSMIVLARRSAPGSSSWPSTRTPATTAAPRRSRASRSRRRSRPRRVQRRTSSAAGVARQGPPRPQVLPRGPRRRPTARSTCSTSTAPTASRPALDDIRRWGAQGRARRHAAHPRLVQLDRGHRSALARRAVLRAATSATSVGPSR